MQTGSALPSVPVQQFVDGTVNQIDLKRYCEGRTVVLVALPGAFTPTCSEHHVPGYLAHAAAFRRKGVDAVVILATSDFFVVKAWADTMTADPIVEFMADGSQRFAEEAGQLLNLGELGLGLRTQRYAAVVRNGTVDHIFVEPDVSEVTGSAAERVLKAL